MRVADSRTRPNEFARSLFDGLPARYDRLAEVLSLGQNRRWRKAMVDAVSASPATASPDSSILDVATGPAGVALQLARRTGGHVIGIDLTPEMLRAGAANVARLGYSDRISLAIGRGESLPFADSTFDALTFTSLLRYVSDPAATLRELARVVKPGGVIASLEFHVPPNRFWRSMWVLYTRIVLPLAGLATGGREWFWVGRFLGPSITAHYRRYPLDWHVSAWASSGIEDVQVRTVSLGGGLVMSGRKAG
ncbi:MAG TPA: class I SAM-dependent methyltransferase [Acidimicrobiales bacterium]|nr:class I SAM-dependent methyltransferase [Acidimicrobiales bacterium]